MDLESAFVADIETIKAKGLKVIDLTFRKGHVNRYDWTHLPTKSGVYILINTRTNKSYIGATSNLRTRISSHIIRLKGNRHKKKNIQHDFNSLGEEFFMYGVLDICEDYEDREKFWFNMFKENTYSIRLVTDSNKGLPLSDNAKKLMAAGVSKALKGRMPKNIDSIRKLQRRAILEYENGIFVREYDSGKQAGEILGVCYKRINRIVVRNRKGIKASPLREYPNKNWFYKDNEPVREIKKNGSK